MKLSRINKRSILIIEDTDEEFELLEGHNPDTIMCSKKTWFSNNKISYNVITFVLKNGGSLFILPELRLENVENKINLWCSKDKKIGS